MTTTPRAIITTISGTTMTTAKEVRFLWNNDFRKRVVFESRRHHHDSKTHLFLLCAICRTLGFLLKRVFTTNISPLLQLKCRIICFLFFHTFPFRRTELNVRSISYCISVKMSLKKTIYENTGKCLASSSSKEANNKKRSDRSTDTWKFQKKNNNNNFTSHALDCTLRNTSKSSSG